MRNRLNVFLPGIAAAVFIAAAAAAAPALLPQSSSFAGVTVTATPRIVNGDFWEFEIVLNTHSQDLSDDPGKSAALIGADGVAYPPIAWQGDPPGGHHRKGTLQFKAPKSGSPAIELRIQRPGEPSPRSFRWKLQ